MDKKNEEHPSSTKPIFDAIGTGDMAEFKNILAQLKGSVDLFDENGMTALQHASYKGNKEMVQLLLDRVRSTHCFHVLIFVSYFRKIPCKVFNKLTIDKVL